MADATYTTAHIARAIQQTPSTVRRYLKWKFPHHESGTHYRFGQSQYDSILEELNSFPTNRRFGRVGRGGRRRGSGRRKRTFIPDAGKPKQ